MALADVVQQLDLTAASRARVCPNARRTSENGYARTVQNQSPVHESATELVGMPPADSNITDLIVTSCADRPDAPVYAVRNGAGGWVDVHFTAFLTQVRAVAAGLIARGVQPGDRVGLFSPTSYAWAVLDQAVWFAGAVSVPIYETSSAHQVEHIVTDSGLRVVAVGSEELDERVAEAAGHAGVDVATFPLTDAGLAELAEAGAFVSDDAVEHARSLATLASPASIVYTSGTTSRPKGVLHAHRTIYGRRPMFLIAISIAAAAHGANPLPLLWGNGTPFVLAGQYLAAIPVYAVWALPTIGWLLLCSAWAKGKPFLWAIVIPVLLGVFVWWFEVMGYFGLQAEWFWQNVVARMLLSVVPAGWMDAVNLHAIDAPGDLRDVLNLRAMYSTFLSPKMWIGAAAGALMIAIAVRLRRWREEI